MDEKLTIQELKALCEYFYNEGWNRHQCLNSSPAGREARGEKWAHDFETTFDNLMQGKYDKAIKQKGVEKWWNEMQQEIESQMEDFDRGAKLKAHQAMEDLRKIVITT